MIDPSDFIKITKNEDPAGARVSGTFICQTCLESIGFAVLNEDEMVLVYTCAAGHKNEATL
jgi:hypothetical protein